MTDTLTTENPTGTTADSGWQLQDDASAAYEAYLVPAIFRAAADRLVALAGVGAGDAVLDVATGTGVAARAATPAVGPIGTVTGLDVNRDMLETARGAAAGLEPMIAWRQGDATALPFDDETFDVVLCQEAVQFLTDRRAAISEMRRVTRPGGRIAFSVFRSLDHHPVYARFAAALGRHAGAEAEQMMGSPFAFGDASALRDLARDAGLRDVVVRIAVGAEHFPSVAEFVRREAASSPLAGPLSELDDAARAALVDDVAQRIADHLDDTGVVFHNETHVVTARR